jgi:hypothetical protein
MSKLIIFNDDVDVDIKCVWCGSEFTLCKKEMWKNAYTCPSCKKPMGVPKKEKTISIVRDESGHSKEVKKMHVAFYSFEVEMPKGKILAFLTKLIEEGNGYCTGINKWGNQRDRVPWIIHAEVKKAFEIEGVKWKLPKMYHGV